VFKEDIDWWLGERGTFLGKKSEVFESI
jgi:hypothetical protein